MSQEVKEEKTAMPATQQQVAPATVAVAAAATSVAKLKPKQEGQHAKEMVNGQASGNEETASKQAAGSNTEVPQVAAASASNKTQSTQSKLVANLHSAATEGKVELVRLLLRCGADANAQDEEFGNTALHQAAWNGFSETVQVLCKYRANTSIKNKAQFTPLHMACQQGHNQTIRLLLMANAKTEAKNSYGDTPLHTAARYGHAGAARILLSAKSNPNQVNKNHDTPLHIAAAMSRRKLTKILVQNGAEPAIKNKQNETAMDIALRKDLIDIQELIANPPPVKPSASDARRLRHLAADQHAHLSELEQRYGHLYGASAGASGHPADPLQLQAGQQLPTAMQLIRQRQQQQQHPTQRPHGHNQQSTAQRALASARHHTQRKQHSRHKSHDDLSSGDGSGRANKQATEAAAVLASARSMAALTGAAHRARHQRTRTLASGADLHLLPELMISRGERRSQTRIASAEPQGLATSDADKFDGRACPPDARPTEWMSGLMGARSTGILTASGTHLAATQPLPRVKPQVIAASSRVTLGPLGGERPVDAPSKVGCGSTSPAASLRSSMSRARKRLNAGKRRVGRHRSSLLIRRGNMGKLTLLRLRNMVNTRRLNQLKSGEDSNGARGSEDKKDEQGDEVLAATDEPMQEAQRAAPAPAHGRRHERMERLRETPSALLRAPNGTQLLTTRPMASLADDTQLYAVPSKSKAKQQQQQVANSCKQTEQQSSGVNDSGCPAATVGGQQDSRASDNGLARSATSISLSSAPSSDMVAALDLLCIKETQSGDRAQVANEDPYTPGYSVIRERAVDRQWLSASGRGGNKATTALPCSCRDHDTERPLPEPAGQTAPSAARSDEQRDGWDDATEQPANNKSSQQQQLKLKMKLPALKVQQVAKPSKLRQLLGHLDARASKGSQASKKPSKHAPESTNSYYCAYSPVVQSSRELASESSGCGCSAQVAQKQQGAASKPKSWFKSKFSLSSNNLRETETKEDDDNKRERNEEEEELQQDADTEIIQTSSTAGRDQVISAADIDHSNSKLAPRSLSTGPERRAALISAPKAEPEPDIEASEQQLIRPKSAISQSNSELIAAQKSLAAAAAAKVKRDRLFKMSLNSTDHISTATVAAMAGGNNHGTGVLTVKTSEPNFWPHHHHLHHNHHGQPLVLAGGNSAGQGGKFMIGGHGIMLNGERSGTNSVGMSDSSPSNNGAESDNSIQTTTGSLNTDNTSSGTAAGDQTTPEQTASPLGILSRILLNNKGLGALRAGGAKASAAAATGSNTEHNATDSSGSTLRNASVSSSSALSSPARSEKQPQMGTNLLDQLSSRSRCPIVLTRSNELSADESVNSSEAATMRDTRSAQPPALPAPRLPAKSALKPPNSTSQHSRGVSLLREQQVVEPSNGLPRVASYTQISTSNQMDHADYKSASGRAAQMARQQSLCNYHAVSRLNYPPQMHYTNHHLTGAGRYHPFEPTTAPFGDTLKYPQHHLSHHDLRLSADAPVDFSLPASAINYEYYLDAPYHLRYPPPGASYLADSPAVYVANQGTGYSQDDSIYIPSFSGNSRLLRDLTPNSLKAASTTKAAAATPNELMLGNKLPISAANHHLQHSYAGALYQNQQFGGNIDECGKPIFSSRPKSSLDTFLVSGNSASTSQSGSSTNSTDQTSACPGRSQLNGVSAADSSPSSSTRQHNGSPSSRLHTQHLNMHHHQRQQPPLPTYYIASKQLNRHQQATNGAYLYSENSIYADHFNQHSDLTVLPTNATESGSSAATYQRSSSVSSSASPALADDKKTSSAADNTGQQNDRSAGPLAAEQVVSAAKQEGAARQTGNSWKPASTNNYRSLVQVNQSSPAKQSNQSSSTDAAAASQEGNSVPSSSTNEETLNIQENSSGAVNQVPPTTAVGTTSDNTKQPCSKSTVTGSKVSHSTASITRQQVVVSYSSNPLLSDEFSGSTVL